MWVIRQCWRWANMVVNWWNVDWTYIQGTCNSAGQTNYLVIFVTELINIWPLFTDSRFIDMNHSYSCIYVKYSAEGSWSDKKIAPLGQTEKVFKLTLKADCLKTNGKRSFAFGPQKQIQNRSSKSMPRVKIYSTTTKQNKHFKLPVAMTAFNMLPR